MENYLSRERAAEIFRECCRKSIHGPWSDQLEKVATRAEYRALRRLWIFSGNGGSTLAGTLCDLKNGFIEV